MVLIVSFSCRISPRTSTVIFRDRSPLATAVVTSAMLRTWAVRLEAMKLTLSVRSFQVPATPGTAAWPPSLPSVPTSRATRVTSEAKALSWSTMVLMVFFSSRISPFTSTVILRERSPRPRPWSLRRCCGPGRSGSTAIELTLSVRSFQVPATPGTSAWPPSLPSVPTSRATRVDFRGEGVELIHHRVDGVLSARESRRCTSTVIFFERSPLATAVVTSAMLRTWAVRFDGHRVDVVVRSFQVPATPGTSACPPSLPSVPTSRATRVTSEAKALSWSTIVLMVFFSSRISPLDIDRDLPRQVAVGHGGGHFGDVADLSRQVRGHEVDVVGEVLPRARHAGHLRLAAQLAFGAHFAGHAGDFRREGVELVHHRVDGVLKLAESRPCTSTVILRDRSPRATAVVTSAMLRTWAVRLAAIELTLSVRSFQVPATPGTSAWPPSLPSVPTSRATRVTSEAKRVADPPSC